MAAADGRQRVLYVSHTSQVSGAERVLLTMLDVLDCERYEPLMACPEDPPDDVRNSLAALVRERAVTVLATPALRARFTANPLRLLGYLGSFAASIAAFRRTVRRAAPALLHANSVRAGIVATIATVGMKLPVLWHVQDDLPAHPISRAIRQLALRSRRTSFVAVSQATARAFAGRLDFGARLHVLPNAIQQSRFPRKSSPLDAEAAAFRASLPAGPEDLLIVAAGMINARKGLAELLAGFAVAVMDEPRLKLAIVGGALFNKDHLLEAALKDTVEEKGLGGSVFITGPRRDMPAVLRAADLLVLNAYAEPFGLVVLEAMASGTPVMATKVGGIPKLIEDCVNGMLMEPGETAVNLAGHLLAATQGTLPMASFADEAYTVTLPRFSLERFTVSLHALYAQLLGSEAAQ